MDNLLNTIKNLGAARGIALAVALVVMLALFSSILNKSNTASLSLLYGGLEEKEAANMISELSSMNIVYEVKGSSIYVPKQQADELRLKMAGAGLVGSNNTGYEIFDNTSSFGTTSLVQNINARRALEGELARTITSLPAVKNARVHLVIPKKKLFAKDGVTPSASVALNLGARILTDEQVQSITHLVAAAVPGLTPKQITVVDNRGTLLSNGKESSASNVNNQRKLKSQVENEYQLNVTKMLERVVGAGKVNVSITADMNFDRIEEDSELFDPEQQVVRSEQRSEDTSNSKSSTNSPNAGASANIPEEGGSGAGSGSQDSQSRSNETINYEISKTLRKYVREGGVITRLSVAVLVEGKFILDNGEEKYVPYTSDELDKFSNLVKNTVGFDSERNDSIEIVDMEFVHVTEEEHTEPLLSKEDYFRIIEYTLMIIAALLIIFAVIKPLIKSAIEATAKKAEMAVAGVSANAPLNAALQAQENAPPISGEAMATEMKKKANSGDSLISLDKVDGKVKESSIKKVAEIIDEYPEESINVIRSWIAAEE